VQDVKEGRETVAPRAGEDRAIDARLSERGHEFADIDVHSPAVTRAGLGEWRGVHREDGEPAHQPVPFGVAGRSRRRSETRSASR